MSSIKKQYIAPKLKQLEITDVAKIIDVNSSIKIQQRQDKSLLLKK